MKKKILISITSLVLAFIVVGLYIHINRMTVMAGYIDLEIYLDTNVQPEQQDIVIYPPSITTDRQKLEAVYSLIEQGRLKHNALAAEARSNWKKYETNWYNLTVKPRSLGDNPFWVKYRLLLQEQTNLRDKIRKATYTDEEWQSMDIDTRTVACLEMWGDKDTLKHLPTLATSSKLTQINNLTLDSVSGGLFPDPLEDFTTYTETDEANDLTVTTNNITIDTMDRDVTTYVNKSYGANHFGDFEHLITLNVSDMETGNPLMGIWSVDDGEGTRNARDTANNGIDSFLYNPETHFWYIQDYTNDNQDIGYVNDGTYYATIERASTTATCKIYTDAERTSLSDTLTITCGTDTYEYIGTAFGWDDGATGSPASGWIANLDLQEAAEPEDNTWFVTNGWANGWSESTGTYYIPIFGDYDGYPTEAHVQIKVYEDYTFANHCIKVITNTTSANSTLTFRVNDGDGNGSITIPAGETGYFQDTSSTDNVSSGDLIDYKLIVGAGGNLVASYTSCTYNGTSPIIGVSNASSGASLIYYDDTEYTTIMGFLSISNDEGTDTANMSHYKLQNDTTLSNVRVYISTNTLDDIMTITPTVNGVPSNQVIVVPAGDTGAFENTTNTTSVNADDVWSYTIAANGSAVQTADIRLLQITSNSSLTQIGLGNINADTWNDGDTFYFNLGGNLKGETSNETTAQQLIPGGYSAKNLFCNVALNTLSGDLTVGTRVNEENGNLSITIPSGQTGLFEDTDHTDTYQADDLVNFIVSAAAGSGNFEITYIGMDLEPVEEPDIYISPTTRNLGVVSQSATIWTNTANSTPPSWPLTDGDAYFTVTNNGSMSVDITIKGTNFVGGTNNWTLVHTSPGSNEARWSAWYESANLTDNVTFTTSEQNFITSLAASANIDIELRLETGTFDLTEGGTKTCTITLTAGAS